jgi:hypothetical protein
LPGYHAYECCLTFLFQSNFTKCSSLLCECDSETLRIFLFSDHNQLSSYRKLTSLGCWFHNFQSIGQH